MKSRGLIILIAIWVALIAALVVFGIGGDKQNEVKNASEEAIVSVTGTGLSYEDMPSAGQVAGSYGEGRSSGGQAVGTSGTSVEETTGAGRTSEEGQPARSAGTSVDAGATEGGKPAGDIEDPSEETTGAGRTSEEGQPAGSAGSSSDDRRATPTSTPVKKKRHTCRFTIECRLILDRRDLWRDGLEEVVPEDGVFFSDKISYKKGQSVYTVLKKICDKNDILLDADYTPLYDTYYVRGIGNLYEFDCGSESGWKYSVNGVLPGVGSSLYEINDNDEIVFFYDIKI